MNDNPKSRQIVAAWFNRAKSGAESYNEFDRFICLWVSFNCFFVAEFYDEAKLLGEQKKRKEPPEQDYLEVIYTKPKFKTKYLELLENQDFKNKVNKFLNYISGENHVTELKGKVIDMRPRRQTEINAKPFDDINNFEQFILVVYQIRCNLFHGNKSPNNDTDVKLVKSAFDVLLMLLDKIYLMEGYV